jgi:hypothetical protein
VALADPEAQGPVAEYQAVWILVWQTVLLHLPQYTANVMLGFASQVYQDPHWSQTLKERAKKCYGLGPVSAHEIAGPLSRMARVTDTVHRINHLSLARVLESEFRPQCTNRAAVSVTGGLGSEFLSSNLKCTCKAVRFNLN